MSDLFSKPTLAILKHPDAVVDVSAISDLLGSNLYARTFFIDYTNV